MTTHYEETLNMYRSIQNDVISLGHRMIIDIAEGKTIRQMSVDLCGNSSLEDRLGRWVMAAEWDSKIKRGNGRLYEEAREWLSPSHFTVLWKIYQMTADYEYARDLMEQCLVRNLRTVVEVRDVRWLRGHLKDPGDPSPEELRHKFWKLAARVLLDLQSELERKGLLATEEDQQDLEAMQRIVKRFAAVEAE